MEGFGIYWAYVIVHVHVHEHVNVLEEWKLPSSGLVAVRFDDARFNARNSTPSFGTERSVRFLERWPPVRTARHPSE